MPKFSCHSCLDEFDFEEAVHMSPEQFVVGINNALGTCLTVEDLGLFIATCPKCTLRVDAEIAMMSCHPPSNTVH